MKDKIALAAAVFTVAAALVAVPMTAASSVDTKLQIGYNLRLFGVGIGPGGTAGTFIASGDVQDAGTATGQSTVTPFGSGGDGRLEGTVTLVGSLGTITEEFSGIAGPLGHPHTAAQGTFRLVGGTGAYAGITGEGTFTTVADFSTNQAVRIDVGEGEGD
jgi:hypothetical protein